MNRRMLMWKCCLGCAALGFPAWAAADVPRLIHYQGKLVTDAGAIVPGPVDLRVRLYDDPTAPGMVLFDESHTSVDLNRGLFSVLIGSQTGGGVPDSVLAGSSVYLGVAVAGAAELSPRIRIATAPYAGKSRSAEQLVIPGTMSTALSVDGAGRFGMGTETPDASAFVEMSSATGGLLPPRMTEVLRDAIASPAAGLMLFNTTSNCLNIWNGSAWVASGAPSTPGAIIGSAEVCVGDTESYSVADVPGASNFSWTVPTGATVIAGQGTTFATVTFGGVSGNVGVSATNSCGTSASSVLAVNVFSSAPATPGAVSGPSTVNCGQTGVNFSIAPVPNATSYTWSVPSGSTIASGQGTTAVVVDFASPGDVSVVAGNPCGNGSSSTKIVGLTGGGSQTFSFTGGQQTFTVPACVGSLTVQVFGAQGGRSNGGFGGSATGRVPVTPGEALYVYVGGRNGFNGGGAPFSSGGPGGGGSDVRQGGTAIANRVIVAGGGGGGNVEQNNPGGIGGGGSCGTSSGQNYCGGGLGQGYAGNNGQDGGLDGGAPGPCQGHGGGGSGGGFLSGGGGACGNYGGTCRAQSGALGQGGAACTSNGYSSSCGAGGGGGGYYGGGGGASGQCGDGCGGGGSSWTGSLAGSSMSSGVRSGEGEVVINW